MRDEILNAPDLQRVPVEVPEWPVKKGSLFLQELCVNDAEALREIAKGEDREKTFRVQLVIKSLVDKDRRPIFEESDAERLATKSNAVITRLSDMAIGLIDVSKDTVDRAEKNSPSTPTK